MNWEKSSKLANFTTHNLHEISGKALIADGLGQNASL